MIRRPQELLRRPPRAGDVEPGWVRRTAFWRAYLSVRPTQIGQTASCRRKIEIPQEKMQLVDLSCLGRCSRVAIFSFEHLDQGRYLMHRSQKKRSRVPVCLAAILALLGAQMAVLPGVLSALEAPANSYVSATVSGGVPSPTSALDSGDCALLIQMTGTVADGLGTFEILDPATAAPTRTYSNLSLIHI